MFNPLSSPPPRTDMSALRVEAEKNRAAAEAKSAFMEDLMEMMEEHAPNKTSKAQMGIMLRVSKVHSAVNRMTKYADPMNDNIPLEQRQAALECLDSALNLLTTFANENVIPTDATND